MKPASLLARSLLCAAFINSPAAAVTRTVGNSGADFTSLQAAINAANPGDVIDVRNTITEKGILIGKNLTIKSTLPTPQIVQADTTPGTATDRVFYIFPGNQVTMENLIVRHGVFPTVAGGIANYGQLNLLRVRIEKNRSANGGGVFSQGTGSSVTLTECTVESNHADATGGGLYGDGSTTMVVQRSTFAKNDAFEGGAIMCQFSANLTVTNSTISMNLGPNGGAGIFNTNGGTTAVNSCTFSHNSFRAIQNNNPSANSFTIRNSIVANSLIADEYETEGEDCALFSEASFTDLGHNLVEHPNGASFTATGSVTGIDPQLGALADYGGPTRVHALGVSSPALNTGNGGLGNDQRGFARPTPDDKGSFLFRDVGESLRPAAFCAPVMAGAEIYFAEFRSQEFRGPNFVVQIQNAGGGFDNFTPDYYSHGTYVGTVDGLPGAIAGGTYFPTIGRLYWHLIFEDGKEWDREDGATRIRGLIPLTSTWPGAVPLAGGAGSNLLAAEVGVDLPNVRFTTKHSSNGNDALAMIEHSIMATNLVYMRQAGIQHRLGRVILRGSAARDPYAAASDDSQHLNTLTNQWDNVLYSSGSPGTHDLATVVRADDIGGLAGVETIGSPKGYSSCDATARGNFSGVFRHEAGHNWGMNHLDGGAPEGNTLNSGNDRGRVSGPEQYLILNYRARQSAQYLDNLGSATVPVPPSAATDRLLLPSTSSEGTINLLANDHDANGEAINLVSFTTVSELGLGGTLSSTATPGVVKYTPPATAQPFSAIDRFRYRIRDASGQEAEGFVFARVVKVPSETFYIQNFNSFANGTQDLNDGSYIDKTGGTGNIPVTVQSQALRLTPDATEQQSKLTLPSLPGFNKGYLAQFRYQFSAAGTPADWLAVDLGPAESTRLLRGLRVEFNTFASQGYHVKVDGVDVPNGFVAKTNFVDGQWHNVSISWLPQLGLSMTVDSTAIFTNLPIPGFTPAPDAVLGFAAFTGGLSQVTLIDDIGVISGAADLDADGIPAVYEGLYGLSDLNSADADSDSDGDNFSALFEYQIGTRANSYAHRPLWEISRSSETNIRLSFGPVVAGKIYHLKSSTGGPFQIFTVVNSPEDAPVYALDVPISEAAARMFILEIPAQ